jgi:hypothetical protein
MDGFMAKSRRLSWGKAESGGTWGRLAEAYRIHLVHLFDPVLAAHTSLIDAIRNF